MKKLIITSFASLAVVGAANATTYIGNAGTGTADWANWITAIDGTSAETAAATNGLANAVNDNAAVLDNVHAELVATNGELTKTNTALSNLNSELVVTNSTLTQTNTALSNLNTEVENTNAHFNSELTKTNEAVVANAEAISHLNDVIMLNGSAATAEMRADLDDLAHEISHVGKELSAGIANVAALSAVAVSDVKQGEVSFGGGYGYHNSQSAVAFGTAVGLTDNWSVNAGLGFNDYDVTVRAGTNVKFKLF